MTEKNQINPREWVNLYADYLYRYAFSRLNDEAAARELVQETFVAALESLTSFQQRSSIQTWLTSILRNKISDEYRRRAKIKLVSTENEAEDFFEENGFWKEAYQPKPFGLEADAALQNKELGTILVKCLKKLPELWNSVFAMKFIDEEKTRVICQRLQITAGSYWVIIHRAKLNLRNCIQKNWFKL